VATIALLFDFAGFAVFAFPSAKLSKLFFLLPPVAAFRGASTAGAPAG